MIERELKHKNNQDPAPKPMMDIVMAVLIDDGPQEVLCAPSLPGNIEHAIEWLRANPPSLTWHGMCLLPLRVLRCWCLLTTTTPT